MELKDVVKDHLEKEREKERLKRVKENSTLSKVILYTNKDIPYCENIKKELDKEGIKYTEKTKEKHSKEVSKILSLVNLNNFPMVLVNGTYLVNGRDFQSPQQLVGAIKYFGHKDYVPVPDQDKLYEYMRTQYYHLFNKINQLEQNINPLINFIQNLKAELEEDNE